MSVQHHMASKWKRVDLLSFAPSLENEMLLSVGTSHIQCQHSRCLDPTFSNKGGNSVKSQGPVYKI